MSGPVSAADAATVPRPGPRRPSRHRGTRRAGRRGRRGRALALAGALLLVIAVAVVVVVVRSPRGDPGLDLAALRRGPCAPAAEAVADSHRHVTALRSGDETLEQVDGPLHADQDRLLLLAVPAMAPQLRSAATELVRQVGLLRIALGSGAFSPVQSDDLVAAQRAVEGLCLPSA